MVAKLAVAVAWLAATTVGGLTLFLIMLIMPAYTPVTTPEGRELVIRERSFLLAMSGDIMCRHGWVLEPRATFLTDDGFAPFASGDYEVYYEDSDDVVFRYLSNTSNGYRALVRTRLG